MLLEAGTCCQSRLNVRHEHFGNVDGVDWLLALQLDEGTGVLAIHQHRGLLACQLLAAIL